MDIRYRNSDMFILEVALDGTLVAGGGETVVTEADAPFIPSFDDVTYRYDGVGIYTLVDLTTGPENDNGNAVNSGTAVVVSDNDTTPDTLINKLVSNDSSITFAEVNDGGDEDLSLVVNPANVDHDALQNFVANEHINHSSVSVVAGGDDGLAVTNNDLTANIGLIVDIVGTTPLGGVPDAADLLLIYDDSATALRSVTYANLLAGVSATDTLAHTGAIIDLDASEATNASWGDGRARAGVTMRVAGSLLGFTFTSDQVITAGQIQIAVSINGIIQNGVGQVATHTAGQNGLVTFPSPIAYVAGDVIDMHARANGAMAPNNQDITVMFEAQK
jgi:hypothetical protein